MANLAQIVNVLQAVILTDKDKLVLTPTYHVMEMYNVHQEATLIPVDVKSEPFIFEKDTLQAVSVSASKDSLGRTHISLTNIDDKKSKTISIDLGSNYKEVSGRILSSPGLRDYNSFENSDKIKPAPFNKATIRQNKLEVVLPPASVVVLQLK
ncbi:MAG: alpha-L-arabinofuranosidase C-terminal domain-containing protein, partial [Flavitalea sp.]